MESKITYDVAQCCLEMARAVYTEVHLPGAKQVPLNKEVNLRSQMGFLITSLTIIYSYLAIEAFVNWHLYKIWQRSRDTSGKAYGPFYQEYGQINEFTKLKDTDLGDLKKRIKVLCDNYEVRHIHKSKPKLWRDFNELLKEARNFTSHPFPDPAKFQEYMKTIQEEHELGKWAKIAEEVISHFFESKNKDLPNWLSRNQFFAIKRFELVRDENRGNRRIGKSKSDGDECY